MKEAKKLCKNIKQRRLRAITIPTRSDRRKTQYCYRNTGEINN